MRSLLIHAALGVLTVGVFFYRERPPVPPRLGGLPHDVPRRTLLRRSPSRSVCTGWYFNVRYVFAYPAEASWVHFTRMLFTNPAAGSGAQDLIVTNVFLFPLWTMIDGPRRGLAARGSTSR